MEKIIEFDNVAKLKDVSSVYSQIQDSYLFSHVKPGSGTRLLLDSTPMKLTGTLLLLIRGGRPFDIEINLEKYTLGQDTFMAIFPGNVVKLLEEAPDDLDAYALFFDLGFLQNVNINMSAVALPPLMQRPQPVQQLSHDEADLLTRYFELLHLNALDETNQQINKNIATSLIASLFYQLVQFYHKRLSGIIADSAVQPIGRRHDYVRDFIKLVHIHYIRERSVSFYAEKLFISSKYLSMLVKEATGRTAARWIDDFVIMEAKNMLRFSGKNIQQVAFALNFPTQSSFGKFFKHITGMSPTEYQKS
ncbi:MAG: helix-turn-helix domain-containing protein [Bacteroidales bacterium]|nr:helix-turn-helix domain-containing protein [Bacteroidales bacterium]